MTIEQAETVSDETWAAKSRIEKIIAYEDAVNDYEPKINAWRWNAAKLMVEELKESGISQAELARQIGKSAMHVSRCVRIWNGIPAGTKDVHTLSFQDRYRELSSKPEPKPMGRPRKPPIDPADETAIQAALDAKDVREKLRELAASDEPIKVRTVSRPEANHMLRSNIQELMRTIQVFEYPEEDTITQLIALRTKIGGALKRWNNKE